VYPDPRVVQSVRDHFVPMRVNVREQPEDFKQLSARFGELWTPTILVLDLEGEERHRVEGFLPVEDLLSQLGLGLGKVAMARGDFAEAERRFREVTERYPASDGAPEAQYWAGVARYKATSDPSALAETARAFGERYSDSTWAKKASVWRK
jgi:hypothetical protein